MTKDVAGGFVTKQTAIGDAEPYLGEKTLILGDVNSGKTTLTAQALAALLRRAGIGRRIAIVDMAPEIPERIARDRGLPAVGGRLHPPAGSGILYLGGRFEPPRLSSNTEEEAMRKARENRRAIDLLLDRLDLSSRDILLVNDISIYLQAGSAERLIGLFERAATVIANGYRGRRLGEGALSERERAGIETLAGYFERNGRVVTLTPADPG